MSRNARDGENGDSGKTSSEVILRQVDENDESGKQMKNLAKIAMGLANI